MFDATFAQFLGNVGVPAGVCFGLIVWLRTDMRDLTKAVNKLAEILDKRLDKMDDRLKSVENEVAHLKYSPMFQHGQKPSGT